MKVEKCCKEAVVVKKEPTSLTWEQMIAEEGIYSSFKIKGGTARFIVIKNKSAKPVVLFYGDGHLEIASGAWQYWLFTKTDERVAFEILPAKAL